MHVFGLTGPTGAGKTAAAEIFASLGVHVTDTDKVAHIVTGKGSACLAELTGEFGAEILTAAGDLDRKKTASLVFSDKKKLAELSRITHKYITEYIKKEISSLSCEYCLLDGAVIIGSPVENMCEFIISVLASAEVRLARIEARDGLSENEARRRMSAQKGNDFYKAHSGYVIMNDGNRKILEKEVRSLFEKIQKESA